MNRFPLLMLLGEVSKDGAGGEDEVLTEKATAEPGPQNTDETICSPGPSQLPPAVLSRGGDMYPSQHVMSCRCGCWGTRGRQ